MTVVGTRQLRREDAVLLTGEARFVDDLHVLGALHAKLVRSPFAHARIRSIDTSAALALPGVVAVLTGAELRDAWKAPLPCAWHVTENIVYPEHYPLAVDEVRFVGDGVAVVVAESVATARDAMEAVIVEYEELPASIDVEDAVTDSALAHTELETNTSYVWELVPDPEAVERAFTDAHHTVRERYVHQRLIPMAIEPRGVCVIPEPYGGDVDIYSSTQIPHILKIQLAIVLGIPEHKVRVIAPAVGGGFGSKLNVYAEEAICFALAVRLQRPVRWNEDRGENTLATTHGRGMIQDIELAADADGRITAVRVQLLADLGAYLQLVTPGIPLLGAFVYSGVYDVPAYSFTCRGVFTNKTPTDAYRGAGRPEATYAIECAIDALARQMALDPAEIRRRNFIPSSAFPYSTSSGLLYDSGDYDTALERALEMVGYENVRAEQRAAARARRDRRWENAPPRHRDLLVRRDVRARAQPPARPAQFRRRRLGARDRTRAAHGHGGGRHRYEPPRPGPRDELVDDRRRSSRDRHRPCRGAPFRHRHLASRARHLRLAFTVGGRHGALPRV